jgi:cobalt/nickel transport system permease protein
MIAIDEMAYASPAKDWSPLGKLLLTLSLLIASLVASSIFIPMLVFVVGIVLLFYSTKMRFPRVIALLLVESMMIIIISGLVIAMVTAGDPLWTLSLGPLVITFTHQGVELATLVVMRAVAGVTVMLFFATSTPLPYFASAFRELRLPKEIVELTILVYRYSFLLLEQVNTMYVAAGCRLGFNGYQNKFRTTAKLAVGVFTRSLDMAERSQVALDCRCFRGEFLSYRQPVKLTVGWVGVAFLAFAILFVINTILVSPGSLATLLAIVRL